MNTPPIAERIGIVGTGRVARALALALCNHSAAPLLLWGRSPERADEAARETGRCAVTGSLETLVMTCDMIVIATADDAIAPVASEMAQGSPVPGSFACHVSGGSGIAPLLPLQAAGVLTAAVHPAMTFTGNPALEVSRMAQAQFAVTGSSERATAIGIALVNAVGGTAVEVAEIYRPLYHAALCHAANHLVTLISGAGDALKSAGVAEPGALLAPLVRAALDNSLERGMAALSGPVLRGDSGTIESHLSAIAREAPALLPPYTAMARATLDALGESPEPRNGALRRLLSSEPPRFPKNGPLKDPVLG